MIGTIIMIFAWMGLLLIGLLLIAGYVAVGYLVVLLTNHIRHRNAKLETGNMQGKDESCSRIMKYPSVSPLAAN